MAGGRGGPVAADAAGAASNPTSLIVTLRMEAAAAARFTALRQAHFPAHRNWLAAHITLFHALPVAAIDEVMADVADLAGTIDVFRMRVDGLLLLGGGVAYAISSSHASSLRRALAGRWDALLGRQDRAWQGRLHITVQNKVDAATARALHSRLERDFAPEEIEATGLEVWHYLGGPWRSAATYPFGNRDRAPASAPPTK